MFREEDTGQSYGLSCCNWRKHDPGEWLSAWRKLCWERSFSAHVVVPIRRATCAFRVTALRNQIKKPTQGLIHRGETLGCLTVGRISSKAAIFVFLRAFYGPTAQRMSTKALKPCHVAAGTQKGHEVHRRTRIAHQLALLLVLPSAHSTAPTIAPTDLYLRLEYSSRSVGDAGGVSVPDPPRYQRVTDGDHHEGYGVTRYEDGAQEIRLLVRFCRPLLLTHLNKDEWTQMYTMGFTIFTSQDNLLYP